MKFVTYLDSQSNERSGLLTDLGVLDLSACGIRGDMLTLIRDFDKHASRLEELAQAPQNAPQNIPKHALIPLAEATLVAPVPHPVSMRDGYAFRQHVESARKGRGLPMIPEFDHFPVFYFTHHLAVTGPGDVAVQKLACERLDFELEVAIVLGKGGRNIPASRADDHIFGYMIMNDWSARALQAEEMKLNLGPAKGKDFATSLGPYLITRDELSRHAIATPHGEKHHLSMKAFINGKQYSQGNLSDMHWTFAQIIERASYGVTLYPGEVIGSGTVGTGCLMELNLTGTTQNLWLKAGDEVVLEVEELGKLVNRIVAVDS